MTVSEFGAAQASLHALDGERARELLSGEVDLFLSKKINSIRLVQMNPTVAILLACKFKSASLNPLAVSSGGPFCARASGTNQEPEVSILRK